MMTLLPLLLGLSLGCTGAAGGFVAHVESVCVLDDDGTLQDYSFCISFNKDLLTCWDPDNATMIPVEFGALKGLAIYLSEIINHSKQLIELLSQGLKNCETHTQPFWRALTQRIRLPSVQVAKTSPFNTREPVMLACYVSGFYPADVVISWRKNGKVVSPHNEAHDIIHPNGDWTYQTVSYLATNPSFGDTYICVVEHIGSPDPILTYWTPWLSPIQIVKVSVSVMTLSLGLIIFFAGFLSWRKSRFAGYTYVPVSH